MAPTVAEVERGRPFRVVETKSAVEAVPSFELMLANGNRLRIPQDAAALKLVLAVLRQQD